MIRRDFLVPHRANDRSFKLKTFEITQPGEHALSSRLYSYIYERQKFLIVSKIILVAGGGASQKYMGTGTSGGYGGYSGGGGEVYVDDDVLVINPAEFIVHIGYGGICDVTNHGDDSFFLYKGQETRAKGGKGYIDGDPDNGKGGEANVTGGIYYGGHGVTIGKKTGGGGGSLCSKIYNPERLYARAGGNSIGTGGTGGGPQNTRYYGGGAGSGASYGDGVKGGDAPGNPGADGVKGSGGSGGGGNLYNISSEGGSGGNGYFLMQYYG